jgi:hypothetical protein
VTAAVTRTIVNKDASWTIQRVEALPDDAGASYSMAGDVVKVKMRDDLITGQGARVLAELLTDLLQREYQRKAPLVLVHGGR